MTDNPKPEPELPAGIPDLGKVYRIKYDIEQGYFSAAEVHEKDTSGGADTVLVGVQVFNNDNTSTVMFLSFDGRTGEPMTPMDMYQMWITLAGEIASDEAVPPHIRELPGIVYQKIMEGLAKQQKSNIIKGD